MLNLTYTRQKPTDGDDSATWMDALANNADIDDTHDHDGINSIKLNTGSIAKEAPLSRAAGDWTGSAGSYELTTPIQAPSVFQSPSVSSVELCTIVITDSITTERLYLPYKFVGTPSPTLDMSVQIYSNTPLNIDVLFI